jgi:glycosyltransferase involved in cell wall biosynthesis
MKTLVVPPTFDEPDNLAEVLRRLRKAVPAADVLVVDDSSPDSTAEIAKVFGAEPGGVDVLVRTGKWGLGSAYRDGLLVTWWELRDRPGRPRSAPPSLRADLAVGPSRQG